MRILFEINSNEDIYQPTDETDIRLIEKTLNFKLPPTLLNFYIDPDIEIIKKLPTLLWPVDHPSIGIINVNRSLRALEYNAYPDFLIAFATNECGDYWVVNAKNNFIHYIDPDLTMEENFHSEGSKQFTFDDWLKNKLGS